MSEPVNETSDDARRSRRRVLQAAAAAGVGAATFGTPHVSIIPAYGFTNSQGVTTCFYISWNSSSGKWLSGTGDTNADSLNPPSGDAPVTYTWNNPGGLSDPLTIVVSGDPAAGGGATITATPPPGCTVTLAGATPDTARSGPPSGCALDANVLANTSYTTSNFAASGQRDGKNYLTFDLSCP